MNELAWLQRWYEMQCDGKWEHQNGIEIGTLDNPGWSVEITGLGVWSSPMHFSEEDSETSWIRCSLVGETFKGFGGPSNLERIIQVFMGWWTEDRSLDS